MKFKSITINYLLLIFLSLSILAQAATANPESSIWGVLRQQFAINHELHRPEVQKQLRWLVAHPTYIQKLAKAEPYIYHILSEVKKRNLPGEIALIPMIESTFDPFAYSGAGAAGLWQLMPETSRALGIKRDWWFDGRRSIGPSTEAALNYLSRLHKFFNGNWIMAFAAYDSGEGTMARAIKKINRPKKDIFWALTIPRETKNYIPKLLALAEVIQHPERYHIQLPHIPNQPYFKEVNIGSQIDLDHAAKLAGIPYQDLIRLNAGFNRWATAPYRPYKLLIPTSQVDDFSRKLAQFPEEKRVSWTRHQVSSGESLALIAKKYNTTVKLIKELNQLNSNTLKRGQYILIPSSKNTLKPLARAQSTPSHLKPTQTNPLQKYKIIHIVQKNDTYALLEKKYGVSENEIRHWNMLSPQMPIKRGQQLLVWKTNAPSGPYIIQKGDRLSLIAKRYQIALNTLLKLNPHLHVKKLKPGQIVVFE